MGTEESLCFDQNKARGFLYCREKTRDELSDVVLIISPKINEVYFGLQNLGFF